MQKQLVEMIEKSTESAMESTRKFGEFNMRLFDNMFQQQAELAAFYMDASARGLELMGKAKGYQDLMAGQVALMRECGERNMDALRKGVRFADEATTEYSTLAQEGFKTAKEQAAAASSMAMKATA